jgi:NAD dependent epimerase/dehydratase family enzyme
MNGALRGPMNASGPLPVTNSEFTRALSAVLSRPAVIPVPPLALKLMFGEMAEATVLASQRVVPEKLLSAGFTFDDQDVGEALRRALRSTAGR